MADERSHRIPIIVALIGLFGTLTTALVAYLIATSKDDAPVATTAVSPPALSSSEAVDALAKNRDAQIGTLAASTNVLDDITAQIENSGSMTPDISGRWRDDDGSVFTIDQQGTRFSYRYSGPVGSGTGDGTIGGQSLRYRFQGEGGAGTCEARLAEGNQSISGRCSSGGDAWEFRISRQPAGS